MRCPGVISTATVRELRSIATNGRLTPLFNPSAMYIGQRMRRVKHLIDAGLVVRADSGYALTQDGRAVLAVADEFSNAVKPA